MHILITGGSGFIGRALCQQLLLDGHSLILQTRNPAALQSHYRDDGARLRCIRSLQEIEAELPLQAVINLAGAGLAERPWTAARKQQLRASRQGATHTLVHWLKRRPQAPAVLISASAIAAYGDCGERPLTECSPLATGFLPELCADWEAAAAEVSTLGTRLCLLRMGMVLGTGGGLLKRLLPVFGLGLGGRLGSGEQWLAWIALGDLVNIMRALLTDHSQSGVFNACAPKPLRNAEFTAVLAQALGRPAFLHIPAAVLRTAMGEMSELALASQRALPERLLEAGFRFRAPTLEDCLRRELR